MAVEPNTPDPAENGGEGGVQFTPEQQAHIDKVVKDRLNRQKAQLTSGLPSEDDINAWKQKAEQFDAIEDASKDELQRAQDALDAANAKLAEKDSEIDSLKTANRNVLVKQAITAAASLAQYGEEKNKTFVNTDDAVAFIDTAKVEFDDEGNPSNVGTLVAGLAGSKPHLLGEQRAQTVPLDGGARETTTDNPALTPEQEHAQWLAQHM